MTNAKGTDNGKVFKCESLLRLKHYGELNGPEDLLLSNGYQWVEYRGRELRRFLHIKVTYNM